MAEIAAGVVVAEQVIATAVEGSAAAVAVSVPTLPLKATLRQLATSAPDDTTLALARTHHTFTVVGNKAYLFGGIGPDGALCSNDIHAFGLPGPNRQIDYACYPAFPLKDATGFSYAPAPRAHHAACARGNQLIIHGGVDTEGRPVDDGLAFWTWDAEHLKWTKVTPDYQLDTDFAPRSDHQIFVDEKQDILVLHGGRVAKTGEDSTPSQETWLYEFEGNVWTKLPTAPAPALSAAYAAETLYIISEDAGLGGAIHYLDMQHNEEEREKRNALVWQTANYPANPLTPGPLPRRGGALVPVTTGMGRHYLIYMLGRKTKGTETQAEDSHDSLLADIWSLQLPTSGYNPAALKDAIRDRLPGWESGAFSWAQVQIEPLEETAHEGKAHPGPRALVAADAFLDGRGVAFWGGVNAKHEPQGDGWVLQLQ